MATTIPQPKVEQQPATKPTPRDFRQEVTDGIVRMLENGVAPWQKPWEPGKNSLGVPMNPTSGRPYQGGNAIHLMASALRKGYEDPRWMTYRQASEQGWQVRRGEKGTQIEFWEIKPGASGVASRGSADRGDDRKSVNDGAEPDRPRLIHRVYTVFNGQQIDQIPPHAPKEHTAFEAVHAGEQILKNSGAGIAHDQANRAFYNRAQDSIHLPPKNAFKDPAGYYGTALHELAHWTGHPSRLDRSTLNESYRFGDINYAKEELRAELASVFLAAERGIPHNPEQHAAYVGSWIKALKQDKNEIFRAAHDSSAATDFLISLERDRSIGDEELAAGPVRSADAGSSPAVILEVEAEAVRRDRERLEETDRDADLDVGSGAICDPDAEIGRDSASTQLPGSVSKLSDNANERYGSAREFTQTVVRFEPGSGTVNVHAKQSATDRRTPIDVPVISPTPNGDRNESGPISESLRTARAITKQTLGDSAKMVTAHTDSGTYRGLVIAETERHVIQQQSGKVAIAHPKELLDRRPEVGQTVRINYSNHHGSVREFLERSKTKEVSR
jgi:antirestriction protein ArdC